MISAVRSMRRIPHSPYPRIRRATQITKLGPAFPTSHVITPARFLYPGTTRPSRTLPRLFLEVFSILGFLVSCFFPRDTVVVLIAGLVVMPCAFVKETLAVSARGAFHKGAFDVWSVFLAEIAVGGEAPGEVVEGADGAAEGEGVVGGECGWGGCEAHFGVGEGRGAFGAVDSLPAVRSELV